MFAARNRISAVDAAKVTKKTEPSPKVACAARATIEAPPGFVGRSPYATATTVSPTNRMPSSTAIAVIVLAAFFDSGGLNAGTPLAMASTPVRATEPPANALSSSRIVIGSARSGGGNGTASVGGSSTTVPPTMWNSPMATIASARPTNR